MQRRICVIIHLVDDVIVGARHALSDHRRSQHLFDLESLSLIYERRNRNGANVVRNGYGVSGSVIAAACADGAEQHRQGRAMAHWILPRGRVAAMVSAHSTAVAAATRKLSDAAHSHKPFG